MKKILFVAAAVALISAGANFASAAEAQKLQLKNGTNIEITEGAVSVIEKDGKKSPAPDGTHELADGKTITTKDGKIQEEAVGEQKAN